MTFSFFHRHYSILLQFKSGVCKLYTGYIVLHRQGKQMLHIHKTSTLSEDAPKYWITIFRKMSIFGFKKTSWGVYFLGQNRKILRKFQRQMPIAQSPKNVTFKLVHNRQSKNVLLKWQCHKIFWQFFSPFNRTHMVP